jgi:GT2 family glycosyltransferase
MNANGLQTTTTRAETAPDPASRAAPAGPGVEIVVPFFRNEDLVAPLFDSLAACADECRRFGAAIVAVNDSPGYEPLARALQDAIGRLDGRIPVRVVENPENLGFVRSCNIGLAGAAAAGHDALLLNSDTILFPGALSEMARVAELDPMIGFVSPRSNNATIASLPMQEEHRRASPSEAFESFRRLSVYLPDYHYAPTAIGFCMLVKGMILREFGILDEAYGAGYNEENDLVMRANRCGYRAVLANKAFVYHHGESSFTHGDRTELESCNAALLADRYPEYPRAVQAYVHGPIHRAERMLTALLPDSAGRHDLVFDFSDLGSYHNGTIEAAVALLRHFAAAETGRFHLFVVMHAEHARFHGLDRIAGVHVLPVDTDRSFAVGLRVGQPFTPESFNRLNRLAVRTAWFMLDTITWDCLWLTNPDLDAIWRGVFQEADAVIYNSEFTRQQFSRRFPAAASVRHLVSPHSLDPAEYLPKGRQPGRPGRHILVVGNKFPHKHVGPTVDALVEAVADERIECVGLDSHPHPLVSCHAGGNVSVDTMESLYERASIVVFPSHYEGFGFPVLKALAYEKPILMRDSVFARDLKAALDDDSNILLFGTTAEMVAAAGGPLPRWIATDGTPRTRRWADSGREIAVLLDELSRRPDPFSALVHRLQEPASVPPAVEPPEVDPRLPDVLRRVRSGVVGMPVVRAAVRPFWRALWRLFASFSSTRGPHRV